MPWELFADLHWGLVWPAGYVLAGLVLLVGGGDLLVKGADRLALSLGVSPLIVALTIVAIGTSLPELVVSVYAAITNKPDVTVGNAVGSNIFNLLPALGIVALLIPIATPANVLKRDFPVMLAASLLPLAFSWDQRIDRWEAGVLFASLLGYLYWSVQSARKATSNGETERVDATTTGPAWLNLIYIAAGFGLMVMGSRWFVGGSVEIAEALHVSNLVIGLTLVAGGTSLPELFSSLVAVYRNKSDIAVGNIVGSCIFNMLGILGVAGLLIPLPIDAELLNRDYWVMFGASLAALLVFWTGNRVNRLEGLLLFAGYVGYLYWIYKTTTAAAAVDTLTT